MGPLDRTLAFLSVALLGAPVAFAQITQGVSVNARGSFATDTCTVGSVTPDGRYVAFSSYANNLTTGDGNGTWDVFVRDREAGTTERVSVSSTGAGGNDQSLDGWQSDHGRYVSFWSYATNLVRGDTNGVADAFVRDRLLGTTERISVSSAGVEGNGWSAAGPITQDGRYVVFYSTATNLVPNGLSSQVYLRDRQNGTTELVSLGEGGTLPNNEGWGGSISDDGRYVAFISLASNLVPGDTNYNYDVFVYDRQRALTERVDVSSSGGQANWSDDDFSAQISGDGRYVAFMHGATNLVPGDTNGYSDVFVRDRQADTTVRVSVGPGGVQANGASTYPSISRDGRYVTFLSGATNLGQSDPFGGPSIFVHDVQTGLNEMINVGWDGRPQHGPLGDLDIACSSNGRYVLFDTGARNLVPEGANGYVQVYIRDRLGRTSFSSACIPNSGGVIPCPCGNPAGGGSRGCDNSDHTGGAVLSATGGSYVSSDSVVFATSGEKTTATSVLLQGTTAQNSGVVYGQGVLCVGGTLRRLFTKVASGGSITVPEFSAGDPTISARSAAKGNPILAGDSRYYLVFYRDPIVLGGCPASSTFNATQTGQVSWSP